MIDSGIFIAAERGRIDLGALLAEFPGEQIVVSAVTAAELLHGVHRAKDAAMQAKRRLAVEGVFAQFPVIPFDLAIARRYAQLAAGRAAAGRPLAPLDLMIAASALELGHRVLTRDTRSFPEISGLQVVVR
jgi:tRNA(fMet)-specific endonuclease VapC